MGPLARRRIRGARHAVAEDGPAAAEVLEDRERGVGGSGREAATESHADHSVHVQADVPRQAHDFELIVDPPGAARALATEPDARRRHDALRHLARSFDEAVRDHARRWRQQGRDADLRLPSDDAGRRLEERDGPGRSERAPDPDDRGAHVRVGQAADIGEIAPRNGGGRQPSRDRCRQAAGNAGRSQEPLDRSHEKHLPVGHEKAKTGRAATLRGAWPMDELAAPRLFPPRRFPAHRGHIRKAAAKADSGVAAA